MARRRICRCATFVIPIHGRGSALDEGEEELFLVVGVGLDGDFAFACEPADSGEHFLVFELCFFFELFEAEHVSG